MTQTNGPSVGGMAAAETRWTPGTAPVAVVMISLNEGHNLEEVCANLKGWAQEVWLVDSYSKDQTVEIALKHGVRVVQRRFRGFGDQWNFAIRELPLQAAWVLKLDPDERLTEGLKRQIEEAVRRDDVNGFGVTHRLWFMNRPLPVKRPFLRLWRRGTASFTAIDVNEYLVVEGKIVQLDGEVEHHDSPSLEHWFYKQNRYTTEEAIIRFKSGRLADEPRLFGTPLQRRMWLKRNFYRLPGRYLLYFLYLLLFEGAWKAGRVGLVWARLRSDVFRFIEYKTFEMHLMGKVPPPLQFGAGSPDPRVEQRDG